MSLTSVNLMQSIDLNQMLGTPFIAAQQAQSRMTATTIEFLQTFCFEKDASGNNTNDMKTFSVNSFFDTEDLSGGIVVQKRRQLTMPLIAMLNVPALQIQKITVDLTIKIDAQSSSQSENSFAVSAGASAFGSASAGFNAGVASGSASAGFSVNCQVSNSNSSKNATDASSSAKYDVHIEAENKPPAGLAMLMDFCTRPDIAPNRALYPTGQTL
jgi:hypothetical protein